MNELLIKELLREFDEWSLPARIIRRLESEPSGAVGMAELCQLAHDNINLPETRRGNVDEYSVIVKHAIFLIKAAAERRAADGKITAGWSLDCNDQKLSWR